MRKWTIHRRTTEMSRAFKILAWGAVWSLAACFALGASWIGLALLGY